MAKAKDRTGLGKHERDEVVSTTISVRKAGDGLSEAMETAPTVLERGDEVYVVLQCTVAQVQYPPIKGREDLAEVQRKHVLTAGTATFLDDQVVRDAIARQDEANTLRREREAGVQRLQTAQEELRSQHVLGEHADERVDGCPLCDSEVAAMDAES